MTGHRHYHPDTGRWLSRDPIGERGGVNLFVFVRNGPISFVDVLGLWTLIFEIGNVPESIIQSQSSMFSTWFKEVTANQSGDYSGNYTAEDVNVGVTYDWDGWYPLFSPQNQIIQNIGISVFLAGSKAPIGSIISFFKDNLWVGTDKKDKERWINAIAKCCISETESKKTSLIWKKRIKIGRWTVTRIHVMYAIPVYVIPIESVIET